MQSGAEMQNERMYCDMNQQRLCESFRKQQSCKRCYTVCLTACPANGAEAGQDPDRGSRAVW